MLKINKETKPHAEYIIMVAIIFLVSFVGNGANVMGINNTDTINKINNNGNTIITRNNDQNDTAGPMIFNIEITPENPKNDDEISLTCSIDDNSGIFSINIYYCTEEFCTFTMPMDNIEEDKYKNTCNPNSLPAGSVEYHIIAKDIFNNTTEYNGTFIISQNGTTIDQPENGEPCCGNGSTPGFDLSSIIIGVFVITIIFYFKKIKSHRIKG